MDADLTIPEACTILNPPITPTQLRTIIKALGWKPVAAHRNGTPGRPIPKYEAEKIMQLHQALLPWLK